VRPCTRSSSRPAPTRRREGQVVPRVPARPGGGPLPPREAAPRRRRQLPRLRELPRQARPLLRRPRARRPRASGRHRAPRSSSSTSGATAPRVPTTRTSAPSATSSSSGSAAAPSSATRRSTSSGRRRGRCCGTTFTPGDRLAVFAANPDLRDRVALRLLLDYGLRKGALRDAKFKHFDHYRKRLTVSRRAARSATSRSRTPASGTTSAG
jgi:hypothetical protein